MQDIRGTGLSSLFECETPPEGNFNPYNASQVKSFDDCHKNLAATYPDTYMFYSALNGAKDLINSVKEIKPDIFSIYAASVGTYYANSVMIVAAEENVKIDSVVLDGPLPPGNAYLLIYVKLLT